MGNKSQKKTNQMLESQTGRVNALESELGNRSAAAYQQQGDLRNELLGNYRSLYGGTLGEGGDGGGGGGGYSAPALGFDSVGWQSTSKPFYTEAMNTGLWSPERIGQAERYATGPITGIYEGLKRNILSAQRGRGMPGVGSGLERLSREAAYAGSDAALGAKLGINREIDENRFRGAGGVTGLESEERGLAVSERDKALALAQYNADRAASAAASRSSSAAADRAYQLAVLGRMEGLMPEDLPYIDRQLSANQLGLGSVTSRVDETPAWQKALYSIVPTAVSAGVGAFTGGGGGNQNNRRPVDYGDYRSDYGDY